MEANDEADEKKGKGFSIEDAAAKFHGTVTHMQCSGVVLHPIGYMKSCFKLKNGTPRQGSVTPASRAQLEVTYSRGSWSNQAHSLEGLDAYSHVWLIFLFHANRSAPPPDKLADLLPSPWQAPPVKPKVRPPLFGGVKVGVYGTRTPHRPNPIGLSLVKLEAIEGNVLHFSGVDLIDGTPILDVKPCIPAYDCPFPHSRAAGCTNTNVAEQMGAADGTQGSQVRTCSVVDADVVVERTEAWSIEFSAAAVSMLDDLYSEGTCKGTLFESPAAVMQAGRQVLSNDPRSIYTKERRREHVYKFTLDKFDLSCRFHDGCSPPRIEIFDIKWR